MELYALIVAGGSGKRMGSDLPKQFLEVAGKPIILHTLEAFQRYDASIRFIVVLPAAHRSLWESIAGEWASKVTVVEGGAERFHSVKNGLAAIEGDGCVAIHDAVRPLVSTSTIEQAVEKARKHGGAIPVVPVVESVREVNAEKSQPFDRNRLRLVQTPQCFDLGTIKAAYARDFSPSFTDDASVYEAAGNTIALTEGNRENIKITTPADLQIAEALLDQRKQA